MRFFRDDNNEYKIIKSISRENRFSKKCMKPEGLTPWILQYTLVIDVLHVKIQLKKGTFQNNLAWSAEFSNIACTQCCYCKNT